LAILNHRVASPNEIAKELDEPLANVSYHVKALIALDCIELVEKRRRRGAVFQHFYRGTRRAFLSDVDWKQLPRSTRAGTSTAMVQLIVDSAVEALEEGTFDKRHDRRLSWAPMILDEEGWSELAGILSETFDRAKDVQARSAARLAEKGTEGMSTNLSILHYESPSPDPA
jgi:hypothetical protein